MIPKIIHYCWFGSADIPEKDLKCIESWKKFCPDYEIRRWDERNYDITKNQYMYQAYQEKKWAFVSDYARLDIIYEYGGIYLDTDVEIIKNIDILLNNSAFMGFEEGKYINSGLGMGAELYHEGIKSIKELYNSLIFRNKDGTLNMLPTPQIITDFLKKNGAILNDSFQVVLGISIYPSEFFCPMSYSTGEICQTNNTFSIHHFHASWQTENEKKIVDLQRKISKIVGNRIGFKLAMIFFLPRRIILKIKTYGIKIILNLIFQKFRRLL